MRMWINCCSAFMGRRLLDQERVAHGVCGHSSWRSPCIGSGSPASVQFRRTDFWSYWTAVDVQQRRTLMTTPVTTQSPVSQGISPQQQGYPLGFPPSLGIEQYLGQPQQYGGFPQQYASLPQQSHMQGQFPGQQPFGQLPIQQIVQSLVSQLLPIAQQVILPQVVATATQQIPMHLQQLVAQQVNWQLAQQGGWHQNLGQQAGWQQPPFAQQGQSQFGRPNPGSF